MTRMKQLRKERHLTQEAFIDQFNKRYGTNYTAQAVSMIENGRRLPRYEQLVQFAEFFHVSIDYFLCRTDVRNNDGYYLDPKVAEIANEIKDNNGLRVLFDAALGLNVKDIEEVRNFIEYQKSKNGIRCLT